MTEALPKKKNKILMDFIIAAVLASLIFLGYHFRNQWLPLFKKSNAKPQVNTTIKIDTPQTVPNVVPPKPTVVDSPKIEAIKPVDTSNIAAPVNTTNGNQKPSANTPEKPKPEPKPKDEGQLKLVDNNVQQNEHIYTTKQNDK